MFSVKTSIKLRAFISLLLLISVIIVSVTGVQLHINSCFHQRGQRRGENLNYSASDQVYKGLLETCIIKFNSLPLGLKLHIVLGYLMMILVIIHFILNYRLFILELKCLLGFEGKKKIQ